ncbi:MAG: M20/M25/M40 family metallo-hydrolase [Sphingobacteriia bacterium]|jgi:acetylornithine deacetylase/succinyl-diaminopimelate desuccinylase-like protein
MHKIGYGFFCCFFFLIANAQSPETLKIRSVREQEEKIWMKEYLSFLSIPNIAVDTIGLKQNASFIMNMMKQRNISNVQLLNANSKNVAPAIYGEVNTPGATKTLIFYAHYDGQPVDPSQWAKGLNPFKPTMVNGSLENGAQIVAVDENAKSINPDWRIYGRAASDDKAGVMAILSAYEALVKAGLTPQYNLKFFFEGEEEAGSTHLAELFQIHRSLLQSDGWIICDGPVHQSGNKAVIFGVRGDAHVDITLYGPSRPLHSGHYGNWAPNPGMKLAKLLASMKDEKGRVIIKGFYDDTKPLTIEERKALAAIPPVGAQMKKELKFINEEMEGMSLEEAILIPSLNINGMQSGNIGTKASNVIPTSASVVLDLRLVPGNDYQKQQQKVVEHIKGQGYYITYNEPTELERAQYPNIAKIKLSDGYNAQRTSLSLPFAQNVVNAIKTTTKDPVVLLPSMGGSLPLFIFEKELKATTITVPIANHDNNQHAENENIRIRNLWNGIETMAAIMMMK